MKTRWTSAAVGIALAVLAVDSAADPTGRATWSAGVAELLAAKCVSCHSSRGGAPLSLTTYENARDSAPAIKRAVLQRRMPPWLAAKGFADFQDNPSLTPADIELLAQWADDGAPRGEMAGPTAPLVPPAPVPAGAPDLVLQLDAVRPVDPVATFELTTNLKEDRWVSAWEFRPGNAALIRAALVLIAPESPLGTWVPAQARTVLPDGVAQRLPAGAKILLEIHYRRTPAPAVDASSLALYLTRKPPRREPEHLELPCGTSVLPRSVRALAVRPALRSFGASIELLARRPDRSVEPLGLFRDYPVQYFRTYRFRNPVRLSKGTLMKVLSADASCTADLEYVAD